MYEKSVLPQIGYCVNTHCKEYNVSTSVGLRNRLHSEDLRCYCTYCKSPLSITKDDTPKKGVSNLPKKRIIRLTLRKGGK